MCFTQSSKLCVMCLALHAISYTWLPANAQVFDHDHQDVSTSPSAISADDHLSANNASGTEHQNEKELAERNELTEEWLRLKHYYLKDLLERYGTNGVLTYDGLIHMLESLGINPDVLPNHEHSSDSQDSEHSHQENHSHDSEHSKHIHDSDHEKHSSETDHQDHHYNDSDHSTHPSNHSHHNESSSKLMLRRRRSMTQSDDSHNHMEDTTSAHTDDEKCNDLLDEFHVHHDDVMSEDHLLLMCPGILSSLSQVSCRVASTDHTAHTAKHSDTTIKFYDIPAEVWGYSTVSIAIISLVGLLGVAVIPIMQKVFYNHLLQFLVALAVGALLGDAMLHLLPHALQGGHDHSSDSNDKGDDSHKTAVLKGLCGLGAIFIFFIMERMLSIITDLKRKHKKSGSVFVKESGETSEEDANIPLTECGAMRVIDPDCKEQVMGIHPGQKALANFAESSHKKCSRKHDGHHGKDGHFKMVDEENPTSVLSHSHNHHGHSHILPTSVASIAWMVILGDGIHNFSDGLAIGAAFANSITGGFSTSVAVFCHELPHEIGDFAVLLRAGMTVKQAVLYNCVSSILAFIGVLIGVTIGNIGEANTWVFITVAGMFLYIALVDMLPELMSVDTSKGEQPFCHLILQIVGMVMGAAIMLLIALYEDSLMTVMEPV